MNEYLYRCMRPFVFMGLVGLGLFAFRLWVQSVIRNRRTRWR